MDETYKRAVKNINENSLGFQGYYDLGNYYLEKNKYQAYLCFENALYYSPDDEDSRLASTEINKLKEEGIFVPPTSIVILSYNNKQIMMDCLQSIFETTNKSMREIVVIDNASTDGVTDELKKTDGIVLQCNEQNVGFTAGCNQGIKMSSPHNDILLLNNDTLLADNSLFWLRMGLYEDKSVGATGSVTSSSTNDQEIEQKFATPQEYIELANRELNLPMEHPYEQRFRLIGFAYLIKRTALDNVGILDEQYSPGNYEDDDISFKLMAGGYKLLLCKNAFIFHWGQMSFKKKTPEQDARYRALITENRDKFNAKWKIEQYKYIDPHMELMGLIKHDVNEPFSILEVDCGIGVNLGIVKNRYYNASVYGLESDENVAKIGNSYLDTIRHGDEYTFLKEDQKYDYIVLNDVLTRLEDPYAYLEEVKRHLNPGGCVMVKVLNALHHSVLLGMFKGEFDYKKMGRRNGKTARLFTVGQIYELFGASGYNIEHVMGYYARDEQLINENKEVYDQLAGLAQSRGLSTDTSVYAVRVQKRD